MTELIAIIALSAALLVCLWRWIHWRSEASFWEERAWKQGWQARQDRRAIDAALGEAGFELEPVRSSPTETGEQS